MQFFLDLQIALDDTDNLPNEDQITRWAQGALQGAGYEASEAELTVRFVDNAEIQDLNKTYRHKDYPTNILSFPFECPDGVELPLLGDLIIAKAVVEKEALEQQKTLEEHYAHLIVHGVLHLLGYDHIESEDATIMEPLEISIVQSLGYDNPYKDEI